MKSNLFKSIRLTLVLLLLFSGVYTFVIYGVAQLLPGKGKGEMIAAGDKTYYANIGQSFTTDRYFQGRPSAINYNAAGSGGSNKGPYNGDYLETVKHRVDTFLSHNPDVKRTQVPVELVTASGSGLDPDISVNAAMVQVARIAHQRNVTPDVIQKLIEEHTQKPLLGIFGPEKINVLKLNLALDQVK